MLVVTNEEPRRLQTAFWGFLDTWSASTRPFNARDDKLLGGAWLSAAEAHRCWVPATAFFEWRAVLGQKKRQPVRFGMRDGAPFCFAGLWNRYQGRLICTIITTSPSALVAPMHDRMPAILPCKSMAAWLRPGRVDVKELLRPYPAELMIAEDADSADVGGTEMVAEPQLELF